MTPGTLEASCVKRTMYATLHDAREAAARLNLPGNPFRCGCCKWWHVHESAR